jgi:hypothetical protein
MNLIGAAFFVYYIGVCYSIIVLERINCTIIRYLQNAVSGMARQNVVNRVNSSELRGFEVYLYLTRSCSFLKMHIHTDACEI